jgi:hypothetical protein
VPGNSWRSVFRNPLPQSEPWRSCTSFMILPFMRRLRGRLHVTFEEETWADHKKDQRLYHSDFALGIIFVTNSYLQAQ